MGKLRIVARRLLLPFALAALATAQSARPASVFTASGCTVKSAVEAADDDSEAFKSLTAALDRLQRVAEQHWPPGAKDRNGRADRPLRPLRFIS